MDELTLYAVLCSVLIGILTFLVYIRKNKVKEENVEVRQPVRIPVIGDEGIQGGGGGAGAVPNRAAANRNARARMRAAQARREAENEEEEEIQDLGEDIALPDYKIGKKKQQKLAMKAEKRVNRENDERDREERKERADKAAEVKRKDDMKEAEEEAKKEEEERKEVEERELQEQEEYDRMKSEFAVEEEGFDDYDDDKEIDIFKEFVNYIKREKVVVLEDLAAQFKMKTQMVIDRITDMQKDGTLTGVIDDRGKFIYISQGELESVAKFIKQRGRISIAELAESSNTLINLVPEPKVTVC